MEGATAASSFRISLLIILRGDHPIGCKEIHYSFSWTFGEIAKHRWEQPLMGPSAQSDGEFGTKLRVSILASSQDSLPTFFWPADHLTMQTLPRRIMNKARASPGIPLANEPKSGVPSCLKTAKHRMIPPAQYNAQKRSSHVLTN